MDMQWVSCYAEGVHSLNMSPEVKNSVNYEIVSRNFFFLRLHVFGLCRDKQEEPTHTQRKVVFCTSSCVFSVTPWLCVSSCAFRPRWRPNHCSMAPWPLQLGVATLSGVCGMDRGGQRTVFWDLGFQSQQPRGLQCSISVTTSFPEQISPPVQTPARQRPMVNDRPSGPDRPRDCLLKPGRVCWGMVEG